ncbi:hypothetical protein BGX27_008811 [Mortierella sp. AM989]|nr:hypothetical protein BGX27_008811 [Mortierella sp. AM989]
MTKRNPDGLSFSHYQQSKRRNVSNSASASEGEANVEDIFSAIAALNQGISTGGLDNNILDGTMRLLQQRAKESQKYIDSVKRPQQYIDTVRGFEHRSPVNGTQQDTESTTEPQLIREPAKEFQQEKQETEPTKELQQNSEPSKEPQQESESTNVSRQDTEPITASQHRLQPWEQARLDTKHTPKKLTEETLERIDSNTGGGTDYITQELFHKWIRAFDKELSEENRNIAILFTGLQDYVRPPDELGLTNITIIQLPKEDYKVHPMRIGISKAFRVLYAQQMLETLRQAREQPESMTPILRNCILWGHLATAWDNLTSASIRFCFYRAPMIAKYHKQFLGNVLPTEPTKVTNELKKDLLKKYKGRRGDSSMPRDYSVDHYFQSIDENVASSTTLGNLNKPSSKYDLSTLLPPPPPRKPSDFVDVDEIDW